MNVWNVRRKLVLERASRSHGAMFRNRLSPFDGLLVDASGETNGDALVGRSFMVTHIRGVARTRTRTESADPPACRISTC